MVFSRCHGVLSSVRMAACVLKSRACQSDDSNRRFLRRLWDGGGASCGAAPCLGTEALLQRLDDRQLALQDFSLRLLEVENQPARSASGNSAILPDFGGHSTLKRLLEKFARSKSPSTA